MLTDYTDFSLEMSHSDTRRFRFTVKDRLTLAVVDITSWPQFWATAKINLFDADVDAVFLLTVGNGITVINASQGLCEVKIAPANTSSLDYKNYELYMDIQGKDPTADIWTLARGSLTVIPDTTRATA